MARYIWIGILSSFFLHYNYVSAQKPPRDFIKIEKQSFLCREEISVLDYQDILTFIKLEYGRDSEQYKFLIPDTVKFKELYGYSFFHTKGDSPGLMIESFSKLPMVAISYEQAMAYCYWLEVIHNKRKKKSIWQYSLQIGRAHV